MLTYFAGTEVDPPVRAANCTDIIFDVCYIFICITLYFFILKQIIKNELEFKI